VVHLISLLSEISNIVRFKTSSLARLEMSDNKLIKYATKELVLDLTRLEMSDNKLIKCATKELVLDHTRLEMSDNKLIKCQFFGGAFN
jgi:Leucine-rich repeat (LRR) protein